MDYREKYTGSKEEFYFFLKDEIIKLFKGNLKIDGILVVIPDIDNLDYLIKIASDENCGDLTIKVKWKGKLRQAATLEENPKEFEEFEEFEEKSKQGKQFKEKANIDNDGMEINTSVSFDYEPSKF